MLVNYFYRTYNSGKHGWYQADTEDVKKLIDNLTKRDELMWAVFELQDGRIFTLTVISNLLSATDGGKRIWKQRKKIPWWAGGLEDIAERNAAGLREVFG